MVPPSRNDPTISPVARIQGMSTKPEPWKSASFLVSRKLREDCVPDEKSAHTTRCGDLIPGGLEWNGMCRDGVARLSKWKWSRRAAEIGHARPMLEWAGGTGGVAACLWPRDACGIGRLRTMFILGDREAMFILGRRVAWVDRWRWHGLRRSG